jgi:ADP-dependent NAD(P)H-hydrate dehydratase / NAD(P)H-hydrate epimerase
MGERATPTCLEVLSVEQMGRADRLAIAAGIPGERLMEAAGWAVANTVMRRFRPCRVVVLCGPGNNGGDGFVVARLLARRGWPVRVALLGGRSALAGDAAVMAGRWRGKVVSLSMAALDRVDLVVDALFGAGLSRPLEGVAVAVIGEITRRALPVVAVDVPSGVHGDSGAVWGDAVDAAVTVTFFRKKPGHLLLPGRLKCGEVVVGDIGIPPKVLDTIQPLLWENGPACWTVPKPHPHDHKYVRGHAVVIGGPIMSGAARLASHAARRVGAGLVTILAPDPALAVLRGGDAGTIVRSLDEFATVMADPRVNAVLIGPGSGADSGTRSRIGLALAAGKACVLDADALTVLAGDLPALGERVVLTPHDGEFRRLFPGLEGSRLVRARAASKVTGAVVVLKGADTVVAHPDGRAIINTNAPPALATAGSGDVLAGLVVGLMAQGMEPFAAAAAAIWLHGAAAGRVGRGLLAEDIADQVWALPL